WVGNLLVLAQEDLVRGVRGVGLALVHPRSVGVVGVLDVVQALVATGRNVLLRRHGRGRGRVTDAGPRAGGRRRDVVQHAVRSGLVLGARQHHEGLVRRNLVTVLGKGGVVAVGPGDPVGTHGAQRVVRTQRDEHGATALLGLVDTVV